MTERVWPVMSRRTFLKWGAAVCALILAWAYGCARFRQKRAVRGLKKARYFRRVLAVLLCVSVLWCANVCAQVRKPVVSGQFYPSDARQLRAMITGYLADGRVNAKMAEPKILLVPHAGYMYSGPTAGHAFKSIQGNTYDTVVVIAFSHHARYPGVSIFDGDFYRTPLGDVPIDQECVAQLKQRDPFFSYYPEAHVREHSLEVQLPFLQMTVNDLKIVPLVMGDMSAHAAERVVVALSEVLAEKKALIVVSTDLSHYEPYQKAVQRDQDTIALIQSLSFDDCVAGVQGGKLDACGRGPILAAVLFAERHNLSSTLLSYQNSGDTAGDKKAVVGYAAIAFYEKEDVMGNVQKESAQLISDAGQRQLLALARETLRAHLAGEEKPSVDAISDELKSTNGAFVTLHKKGSLRGCIGCFISQDPLYETVQDFVINSALRDPRFPAVTRDEVAALDIEISVLSPMRKIESIDEFKLGTHGILIRKGARSGTFLPQVATETGWSVEEFLGHCARDKAGIGWEGWKDAELYVYTAEVFGEKDF